MLLRRSVLALVALIAIGAMTRTQWLPLLGAALVHEDPLAPADVVVALAGDLDGLRARRAADLVREGYAPLALINGAGEFYGIEEAPTAVAWLAEQGYDDMPIEPFQFEGDSTLMESQVLDAELRRRGVGSALVVTSDFHTARARRIFRDWTSGRIEYRFTAAPTRNFSPDSWWRSRAGQKIAFLEWIKTIHSWFERP